MTPEELRAIRDRVESATPGPWSRRDVTRGYYWDGSYIPVSVRNADFAAHAREDIPKLLDEIERLRGLLNQAGSYVQCGIDNDPYFPADDRWSGVRTFIETWEESE